MKTILHVIDTTGPGGAETMFIELADRLRSKGYRSVVVIRGPGWVNDELLRRSLHPIIIPAKGSFNLRLLYQFISLIRRYRVDVIQSHLLGSNLYCALAGLIMRVPVIGTFHGMVDVASDERLPWLKYKILNKGIRFFVTVSQRLQDAINAQGLLNPAKTKVIYNGIDLQRYGQQTDRELRQELGLDTDDILIGALGNVRTAKAYDVLVKAAATVIKSCPHVHFVVAGHKKQDLMADLELLMDEYKVSGHIHFIGYIDDSATYLAQLDMFVLSSSSEGFSISTIEAMATGLPIVATRCGGPEEIIQHDIDALMVKTESPSDLAEAILKLLQDRELMRRLSKQAQENVRQRFSIENTLAAYMELYEAA